MYPIKFAPIFKSTLWGGNRIIPFKRIKNVTQPQIGESWEISNIPGNESIVTNGRDAGKNLSELLKTYKEALVGQENYKRFGNQFPLLIKFIDACDDLSIQVHPNNKLAKARHNSMGKNEMWYVIGNNQGKAHIRLGLNKSIKPKDYISILKDNSICDYLTDYAVQPDDVFYIPAGRIHSLGAGCFIVEIQQASNITYRIYDFNRKDKYGKARELHTELSIAAIDYRVENDYRTQYTPSVNERVKLVQCSSFNTSVYNLTQNRTIDYNSLDSFIIYICIEGYCTIKDNEGNELKMQAGETVLFPATTHEVNISVENQVKFLETYV